jgi:hypothetical protein
MFETSLSKQICDSPEIKSLRGDSILAGEKIFKDAHFGAILS